MGIELLLLGLVFLLIASYTDLRWREVPDWLSYGLIFAAIGVRTIFSIQQGWYVLLSGLLGLAVCFAIACLFYYSHQWGGGDSKLLMGMGALIGISLPFNLSSFDLAVYFLIVLFAGAIYGLIWIAFNIIRGYAKFKPQFLKLHAENKTILCWLVGLTILLAIAASWLSYLGTNVLWLILPVFLFSFYVYICITAAENSVFLRRAKVEELTEGDCLADTVQVGKEVIKSHRILERSDLNLLIQHKVKSVIVKDGIPFVPSFLLGFVALQFISLSSVLGLLFFK